MYGMEGSDNEYNTMKLLEVMDMNITLVVGDGFYSFMHVSKLFKLYTLTVQFFKYIDYTSARLFKNIYTDMTGNILL